MGALGVKGAKQVGKNRYQLTIYSGSDGTGSYQRHYATVDAKNKHELEQARADLITQIKKGTIGGHELMLFRDLVREWWKNHMADKSPRTREGYESNLRLRILPTFGATPIGKIEKYHIRQFFNKLKQPDCEFNSIINNPAHRHAELYFDSTDKGCFIVKRQAYTLSPATIKNHLTCMKSIFSYAVYQGYIKTSPMIGVKTPPVERKEPSRYSKADLAALLQALADEPLFWQSIVLFALGTGARRGEIAGLHRDHLIFDSRLAIIDCDIVAVKGKGTVEKSTKNGRSRMNKIPKSIMATLKAYDAECDDSRTYFFSPDGIHGPIHPDSISTWWERFIDRNKLKPIKFHGLRHTSVSLSIDAGEEMKDISERVGHSKIGTTADIYGHLFQERKERSADLLDKELNEIKKMGKIKK
jgi:integrase